MKTMKKILNSLRIPMLMGLVIMTMIACNPNSTTSNETKTDTPEIGIHEAAFMGNLKAIDAHIKANTNLDTLDNFGSSPIGVAATFNKQEAAILLIDGGADINFKSGDGSTPLHTAAFFGRIEIVKALREAGADTNVSNNYGATALESVMAPFEDVKMIYDQISKDLGPFGLKLDY